MYLPGPDGQETSHDILPLGGRLVLFLSDLIEHEVLPARRERYSITGWFRRQTSPFPFA
jgi:SM-20-related protein